MVDTESEGVNLGDNALEVRRLLILGNSLFCVVSFMLYSLLLE